MSHMVIYRSVDGKPGFQQTDDLMSAVEFVERLRNADGVESARIYRLEQVSFRFEPYYQVHIDDAPAPTPPPATVARATVSAAPAAPVAPAPVVVAETTAPAAAVPAAAVAAAEAVTGAEPADAPTAETVTPAPEPPADGATGIRRGLFGR